MIVQKTFLTEEYIKCIIPSCTHFCSKTKKIIFKERCSSSYCFMFWTCQFYAFNCCRVKPQYYIWYRAQNKGPDSANHSVIFVTVTRIRPWKSTTQPDAGFDPKNPRCSHKQDMSKIIHGQALVLKMVPYKHIKCIVWYR